MLTHLSSLAGQPSRVVVLGARGFVGGEVTRRLRAADVNVLGLGRPEVDLLAADAASRLASELRHDDVLVFVSARAPCKDPAMLLQNLAMAEAVCAALKGQPVEHVVYISSDAVYKDSASPLSEASCAEPGSLHGVMHLAREVMLRNEFSGPLAIVRPTLIYGIDDPHNGYGPNRFQRQASAANDIALFGEGEEQRDHVMVEDVAELVLQTVLHRSAGVVNAVSGETASFRELAEFVAARFTPRVVVQGSPRTGPMPHNGLRPFAPSAALEAYSGFTFTSWRAGLARLCAATKGAKQS